jgi:hypothetical protein
MKVLIRFIIFFIVFFPSFAHAEDTGSVCLGPFLSVVMYEPSIRPYLSIGNYGPFYFDQEHQSSRLVLEDLDLKKVYKVKVHFDGKVVSSWNLSFSRIGSDRVCIWRDKGAWRMEPIKNSKYKCQEDNN